MKDSVEIEGKIYISSRRAAEISKYANDYIGQLCRAGKISARMVGRTWFVDQDSLLDHKKAAEQSFHLRGKIASEVQKTPVTPSPTAALVVEAPIWTFNYSSDSRPLLPELKKKILEPEPAINRLSTTLSNEGTQVSLLSRKTLSLVLVFAVIFMGGFVFEQRDVLLSSASSSHELASITDSINNLWHSFSSGLSRVFSGSSEKQVPQTQVATGDQNENPSFALDSLNGMAVVKSGSDNTKTTEQIRNSFSDDVTISPDDSGTAGVITPVFKKSTGDEFLYVLVPVKDATSSSSK